VSELNGILEHMEELGRFETRREMGEGRSETTATPIRPDVGGTPVPLAIPRDAFAPEMRDGFFLVPRLETHEGEGERAP
jgi:aspartyl-tRNA(Asn)/glutamyl-tRNA(Gln) amidotransferase subunit C